MTARNERLWAMASHLSALSIFLGVPLGNLLLPIGIWATLRNDSQLVADQALEALDFQLTVMCAAVACTVLMLVAVGIPLLVALGVLDAFFVIRAATHAYRGERFRYPYILRFTSGGKLPRS